MKFNVTLSDEDIEKVANTTADKVLQTVKYQRHNEDWYEREIEDLKYKINYRNNMLVDKDLIIERLRERLKKTKDELNEFKKNENNL